MATITGLTAARMLAIEAASIISGAIDAFGHLILTKHDDSTIDAGSVYPSINDVIMPAIRDALYPVGCIYMTVDETNPGTLFGGTWEAWGSGRVPVGVDGTQAEFDTVEEVGGEKEHTLTEAELAAHTHVQDAHTHVQDAHNHTQNSHNHTQNSHNHSQNAHNHSTPTSTHITGISGYGQNTPINGNGVNIMSSSYVGATTATNQAATATNQAATATNQAATATNQAATATNQNAGGGEAHNNLQPYITCYMWKRTA